MKHIFLCIIMTMGLVACDNKQDAIRQLSDLATELQENSSGYSPQDWQEASEKYASVAEQLEKHKSEYTDEEIREIGRLEGICFACFMKSLPGSFGGIMRGVMEGAAGMMEGLSKGLEDSD
ncbi:MAG: hypothetical protein NC344_03215 [Bacteroidales bacterium]|nr:hypothetical protein [Bacteroidales bacterium]MCM1146840.1 hypothetical protein [Bacteroidales bacterium]MCM1205662.1 hypothetical protein [Bacillota bacterium]MCM1510226.1 hypothetical protein [Clostridium sp.]